MLAARIAVAAMLVSAIRIRKAEDRPSSQLWFIERSKMKTQEVLRRKFIIKRPRKVLENTNGL